MSRRSGNMSRVFSRLFKERQIYHRSDGVVHFISMSTKTQVALALVALAALLWVAYASVNVVFKEQIIVAKERDYRVMETTSSKRIHDAQLAYDDVSSLNHIIQREFDSTMSEISARHQMLRNMVERKAGAVAGLEDLAEGLSAAGGPGGRKPTNGNRIMIDVAPGETTPRQSRVGALKSSAIQEAAKQVAQAPKDSNATDAISRMHNAAAELYTEQAMLLAELETRTSDQIRKLKMVLESTGVAPDSILIPAKISNAAFAQGGPFIDISDPSGGASPFFQNANRIALKVDELEELKEVVERVPLSSPLTGVRRFTSGFGVRRDPISGRRSNHHGMDFAAAWASPIKATGTGVVKFAGTRSGWGRMVEIDHGNGFLTRYAHMSRITVKAGQKVKLHDKVGELGSSGRSTGPHVHYEVLFKGRPLNPRRFIEAGRYVFES
ncbi:MAG: M23 family metallopeptidase [Pseudomonadota bacterium]